MSWLSHILRRRPRVEQADASTALAERTYPHIREAAGWLFTAVSSLGTGWWTAVESALPFGLVATVLVAVAIRAAWLNERSRVGLLAAPDTSVSLVKPAPAPVASEQAAALIDADIQPRLSKLDRSLDCLTKRLCQLESQVDRKFGVRDADVALNELVGPIVSLSKKLLAADPEVYPNFETWRFCMAEWQGNLELFWQIAERWDRPPPDHPPISLSEMKEVSLADYASVEGQPGPAIPNDAIAQQMWRWVAVVSSRHRFFSEQVLARIRQEARGGASPA